ncbi:MAG: hypothetical protein IKH69_02620 [Bacteroidaceae bacterium]|nr:hypothetical protein [Bacteroidaceae bacterium]MBR3013901.1 hypothetical protein [Bacteroidaceae bacterium]MBR3717767.1 hypothetical protein [Bacteroidaceae bacterium]
MIRISISEEFKAHCPEFRGIAVEAKAVNTPYSEGLWQEIDAYSEELKAHFTVDEIKLRPSIAATREAYRRCGKDPSRYRPSGEALCRRVLRGLQLYQIDTLVDIINLVSMKTGYSIGGFDADKIQGSDLVLGVGHADEPYEGIGRGVLNIEGLPVYRDAVGGIGTPTSDHERTKMTLETTHILAVINGYSGAEGLPEAADFTAELLRKYASGTEVRIFTFE